MIHQKGSQEEIIIFTRYPKPGQTKTRLIPELGAEGAASLQRSMTEKVVRAARNISGDHIPRLAIYFTGGSLQQMENWLGSDLSYHAQTGKDLGLRMRDAFQDAWERGASRAVLIGSDCPAIDSRLITQALDALHHCSMVLGPSTDGGYYLIGTTCDLEPDTHATLFNDISWGTWEVFRTTMDRAEKAGITVSLLKEQHDIDLPRDLAYFDHHSSSE